MSTKAARGTKRTCQNPECGARFYDLNRDPIVCPICESAYKIASNPAAAAAAAAAQAAEDKARRPKRPETTADSDGGDAPLVEGDEELADLDTGDDELPAEEEETFIEPEEEEGDVSGILGSVSENEEEA
ncbi:TIGR02300 family protein [Leptospira interrogans]